MHEGDRKAWTTMAATIVVIVGVGAGWYVIGGAPPWRALTVTGLVLDIAGVLILARGVLTPPKRVDSVGRWGGGSGGLPEWFERGRTEAATGLIPIILGFGCQVLGALL